MKTTDFTRNITSAKLKENLEKRFGTNVNLTKYNREQLEDIRNKFRTKIFQQEGSAGINDLLANETYQKDKAMLELLNTRIKEMLGENLKQLKNKMIELSEAKKAKPDFLDMDKDGNKTEPMKKAVADRKVKEGFPTVADAKARAEKEKNKTTGKFDKKELKPGVTQYTRKSSTFTDGGTDSDIKAAKKKAKTTSEAFPTAASARAEHEKNKTTGKFDKKTTSTGDVYTRKSKDLASGTEDERRAAKTMKSKKTGKALAEESGMGNRQSHAYQQDGGANDESNHMDPTEWYIVKDGNMFKATVYPNQEQQAMARGYSRTRDEAKSKAGDQGTMEGSNDDELNSRPGMWRGKDDMSKRVTKQGEPTKSEKSFQGNLKNRIKAQQKKGGLTGPKGVLPEEQSVSESSTPGCKHTKEVKGCKSCAAMKEGLKGKQSKLDVDKNGKLEKSDFAALRAKKKVKESTAVFKHNVQFVNESIGYLLSEDEEGKAKAITAAGDMVNDFTSWMQRVGQYQTKSMIELSDAIRADFGPAEAEAFKQAIGPALSATLEVLTQQREVVSNAVATLAGEAVPEEQMGMEPGMEPMPPEPGMDMSEPDTMNPDPEDEFGASDAAAGMGTTGREMRESREQLRARKLAESHSIMSKLSR